MKQLAIHFVEQGHDVHYLANAFNGATIEHAKLTDGTEFNFKIYGEMQQSYFRGSMSKHLKEINADIFIICLDTFMLHGGDAWFLGIDTSPAKTFFWYPSDGGGGLPKGCEKILQKVDVPVAMAKFGQKQAVDYYQLKSEYIQLGVNVERFHPISPEEKEKLKVAWNLSGKFVIGVVARNQPRKNLDRTIKMMRVIADKIPNAILFLHLDPNDAAQPMFKIHDLVRKFNLENRVVYSGMEAHKGFGWDKMNDVYNLMDCFLLTTCLHPDMPVTTINGTKKIKDIKKGDKVLSSSGKYNKVLDVMPSNHNGNILKIKADGLLPLRVTTNHKIYNVKCKGYNDKRKIVKTRKLELSPAGTLSKYDYLTYPIPKTTETINFIKTKDYIKLGKNQFGKTFKHPTARVLPSEVELDYEFGLLSGFYLSEGCSTKDGLAFCFHTKEDYYYDKLDQILNNRFSLKTRIRNNTRNRTTLWTTNSALSRMFSDLYGKGSHYKKLPSWILDSPKEFRRGLMEGLWKGDGCYSKKQNCNGFTWELQTVSEQLGHSIFNLLIAEGFMPSISKQQRQSMVYRIKIGNYQNFGEFINHPQEQCKNIKSRFFKDDSFVYYPISKITKEEYSGVVYDISVEKDHNFVSSCLVKNSGEGFGIPLVEAMACEVPVVATDYTTTQEIVLDNNAGLGINLSGVESIHILDENSVEYDLNAMNGTITGSWEVERGICDIKHGAEQVEYIYKNPDKAIEMGKNGRKAALRDYDFKVVAKAWDVLIDGD